MRRRSHAQVAAGILAWCSRFSFHGFPIRRSLITSVPPDELKSLGSRRKRLRNAARGNPVASGFRGHLTGTMVGRYFLREQDRIFHVTSSRLLFFSLFSFFPFFHSFSSYFFPFPWQLCAPFLLRKNSLQDGTKVKTKRKRLDFSFFFFLGKVKVRRERILSSFPVVEQTEPTKRKTKWKRKRLLSGIISLTFNRNNILWINLD